MSGKKMLDNNEREKYWNEDYVRYWKARVEEANVSEDAASHIVAGDVKTSADKLYINAINLLNVTKSDNVLEIGCGFGRSLFNLCHTALHVSAVDISEQMINTAKQTCKEENVSFYVSPSEELPFPDNTFDVIVCFAAFDAMYQTEALIEMNRVCKNGARLLITGKNDNYYDDDTAALKAEIGARNKNHPNYFTDVEKLVRNIGNYGFRISVQRYYPRRGDFANEYACDEMPEKFYEFLLVLEKEAACMSVEGLKISDSVSKTYLRHE